MSEINDILSAIKDECEDILIFTKEFDEISFIGNRLVINAVCMSLINIGELVKTLPLEYKNANPQLPWRRIAGMRDVLAHKYRRIDVIALWSIVSIRIPELIEFVEEQAGGKN